MRWLWWTIFGLSITLNIADLIYDGLPIALMVVGMCFRH